MIVVLLLSVLIGLSLGLMGGGGSILAVPVLKYVAGLEAKAAIATKPTAVAASVAEPRRRLYPRLGAIFASPGQRR